MDVRLKEGLSEESRSRRETLEEAEASDLHDPLIRDLSVFYGKRIALFGGSFDPPTAAHLALALDILDSFDVAGVIFVPAARNPLKTNHTEADAEDRIAMLEALLRRYPGLFVTSIEVSRSGPSYTIDTLKEVRALIGSEPLPLLVIGGDCIEMLPRWRGIEEITSLCEIVAYERPGYSSCTSPFVTHVCDRMSSSVSSTEVRAALHRGERPIGLVPSQVMEIIDQRGLYRGVKTEDGARASD